MESFTYGTVSKDAMRDTRLTAGEKGLYAYLCTYSGGSGSCYPSRDLIAHEMQLNKDTIARYLKRLEEFGYIVCTKARSGGRFGGNLYTIKRGKGVSGSTMSEKTVSENTVSEKTVSEKTVSEKTMSDRFAPKNNNIKNNSYKNNSFKNNIHSGAAARTAETAGDMVGMYICTIKSNALKKAVKRFVEMRGEIGRPISAAALKLEMDKLYSLSSDESEQERIIDRSVKNSWLYFYPLKKVQTPPRTPFRTPDDALADIEKRFMQMYASA